MIINTLIFVLLNSIFCFVFMKEKIESCSTQSEKRQNWKYLFLHPHQFTIR